MKGGIMIAATSAAIVAVGMAGCSSDKSTTSEHDTHGAGASASVSHGASHTKVLIDGKDQNVSGTISCVTTGGTVNIAIGEQATGIAAVLSDANPPEVTSVALGNVNGVTLGYTAGSGQGKAEATRDGDSYKITGEATGIDTTNPMQVVKKPFEIDVTCP